MVSFEIQKDWQRTAVCLDCEVSHSPRPSAPRWNFSHDNQRKALLFCSTKEGVFICKKNLGSSGGQNFHHYMCQINTRKEEMG